MMPGPLLPRRRHRREPERAHPGRPLALGAVRQEMLEEAVEVIRLLWQGGDQPATAASTTRSRTRASTRCRTSRRRSDRRRRAAGGRAGRPDRRRADRHSARSARSSRRSTQAGGSGQAALRPADRLLGRATRRRAPRPRSSAGRTRRSRASSSQELPLPRALRAGGEDGHRGRCREEDRLRPDPDIHRTIHKYVDAGFDHVSSTRSAPDQEGFFRFYEREILPRL